MYDNNRSITIILVNTCKKIQDSLFIKLGLGKYSPLTGYITDSNTTPTCTEARGKITVNGL